MKTNSIALVLLSVLAWAGAAAAQTRTDLMFCGSTSRSGASLYSGIAPLNEVTSCAPDNNTQALMVTRGGTISGNGAAWLAYLNNGGIIITEYSISHTVYNEIYGTAYPLGSGQGDCRDNAMPAVKLNPGNAFWVNNPIPVTDPANESCGYDIAGIVSGEAQVTALGGWASGATSFAYRPQSGGVMILLDADWQDSEGSWTADSSQFMGALIGGGLGGGAAPPSVTRQVPALPHWALLALALLAGVAGVTVLRRRV
jgi:hypothetical protein